MEDEARATGLDPARDRAPVDRAQRSASRRIEASPQTTRVLPTRHTICAPMPPRPGTDLYGPTYAALDLGTNNCRLLVARATHDGFRVVDAFSRIIRLGEGITASGRLGEPAIGARIEVLRICRDKMRNRGVTRARLIATEACRLAANGNDFLAQVRETVGIALEIVDRETEALAGRDRLHPADRPEAEGAILFDIGGGSSEIGHLGRSRPCRRGPPEPEMRGWVSLPVGVVTLAERHGGIEVTREIFEDMVAEVGEHMAEFAREHATTDSAAHASAGHVGHGDNHRRRASGPQAL